MSSSSETVRLLEAVARECRILGTEIAMLGAEVSGSVDDAALTALQKFDFLSQHAQALAALMAHLAAHGVAPVTPASVPLPAVRRRLTDAMDAAPADMPGDDLVLWLEP